MKTSELTGKTLNWAVAKCEGIEDIIYNYSGDDSSKYFPSQDWSQGGPIIEKHITKLWQNLNGTFCAQIKYRAPYYSPTYDADIGMAAFINKHGQTPLIAAMRCYVASKLGDEVEIPKELL